LREPAAPAWEKAVPTNVVLSRAPRTYQTEPAKVWSPPALEVRALRCQGKLIVRLRWDDATRNAPQAPPARKGGKGDPLHLYKRPTGATSTFADAAAVMMPAKWTGKESPSLVMGDKSAPVVLYYWNASRGTAALEAQGRGTVQATGPSFPSRDVYANGKWSVTFELPEPAAGCPLAFAVWDGQTDDRDGRKFFSVWYALQWPQG
jgi:hypothetical protein